MPILPQSSSAACVIAHSGKRVAFVRAADLANLCEVFDYSRVSTLEKPSSHDCGVAGTSIALGATMRRRASWILIATGIVILLPSFTVRAVEPDASSLSEGQVEQTASAKALAQKHFAIHLGRGWNIGPTEIFDMVRIQGSYSMLPWLRVGASGEFSTDDQGTLSGCGESRYGCGNQLYSFALVGEVHGFPNLALDPWVGAATGMTFLHHHLSSNGYGGSQDSPMSVSALPFAQFRVGLDVRVPFATVRPVLGAYAVVGPYFGGVEPVEAATELNARLGVEF